MHTFAQKTKPAQRTASAYSTIANLAHVGQSREANSIHHLQREIGKQAEQRLLQSQIGELEAGPTDTVRRGFAFDFGRVAIYAETPLPIMTKLAVNEPGDKYEQEADRVAEQVMRMPEPKREEKSCHQPVCRKLMQRDAANSTNPERVPPIVHKVLHAPGQSLDNATRNLMEPRFGYDFSQVRVHTNEVAAKSAQEVRALAYTVGNDIVFRSGEYAPNTARGQKLIAHELTHVIQQNQEIYSPASKQETTRAHDSIEHGAETAAVTVVKGSPFRPILNQSRQIARRDDLWLPGMNWEIPGQNTTGHQVRARTIDFVTMKRKNISLKGEDKYGHWWTEINGESYGWWPKYPVGLWETLAGTEGELNGQTSFEGSSTRDPHHGDSPDEEFHPVLTNSKTDEQVKTEIRSFANAYNGEWRWTLGWGQNCHTFQEALMKAVGLRKP